MKIYIYRTTEKESYKVTIEEHHGIKEIFYADLNSPLGVIFSGRVHRTLGKTQAFVKTHQGDSIYINRVTSKGILNEGDKAWVQATSVPSSTEPHKSMRGKLSVSLKCGPVIFYPFTAGLTFSKRLQKNEALCRKLSQISSQYGLKFRVSAQKFTVAEINHIIQYITEYWERHYKEEATLAPLYLQDILLNNLSDHATIISNCSQVLANLQGFLKSICLSQPTSCQFQPGPTPDYIEEFWDSVFNPLQNLPNGGNILFEYTSACITIDVNSGSSVESFFNVNRQAIQKAAEVINFTGYGGKILIDLLPIKNKTEKEALIQHAQGCFKISSDISTEVHGISQLGFLELSRPQIGVVPLSCPHSLSSRKN